MNKYHAKKTIIDGITFDSKKESERYAMLKMLVRGKVIKDLKLQPEFTLQEGFRYKGKAIRAIKYRADFSYYDMNRGLWVIEDVKGMETQSFKIKAKLLLNQLKDREDTIFEIVK